MRRRTLALLITAGVVVIAVGVVFAGPLFYRDVVVGAVAPAPTVTAGKNVGPVDSAAVEGTWRVDDGSYAGYRVHEVLNGTETTVVARTTKVTGDVTVTRDAVAAASITVDVASIKTDQSARDTYFRDTAMRTFRYPTATFVLSEPVAAASTPHSGAVQTVDATGHLTLAGVTRTVTVTMDAAFDGRSAQVAGTIPITFADFEIEAPNLGFVRVADTGSVEFLLHLVR